MDNVVKIAKCGRLQREESVLLEDEERNFRGYSLSYDHFKHHKKADLTIKLPQMVVSL